jgi:hypothetical protein
MIVVGNLQPRRHRCANATHREMLVALVVHWEVATAGAVYQDDVASRPRNVMLSAQWPKIWIGADNRHFGLEMLPCWRRTATKILAVWLRVCRYCRGESTKMAVPRLSSSRDRMSLRAGSFSHSQREPMMRTMDWKPIPSQASAVSGT